MVKTIKKRRLVSMTLEEIQDLRLKGELSNFSTRYIEKLILAKLRDNKTSLNPFLVELRYYSNRDRDNTKKVFDIFEIVADDIDKNVYQATGGSISSHIVLIQDIWIKRKLNLILLKKEMNKVKNKSL